MQRVGPNHFMAGREPPLPSSQSRVTYLRNTENSDATSIISMAKTRLVDGKLNVNIPQRNYPLTTMATLENEQ